MNLPPLLERYAGLSAESKRVVAMIALVGGMPGGKTRLVEYLRAARVKSSSGAFFSGSSILDLLSELHESAILIPTDSGESIVARAVASQAIGALAASGELDGFCNAIESVDPPHSYSGSIRLRNYQQGLIRLRLTLLRGREPVEVNNRLALCAEFYEFKKLHPFIEFFGRPFDAELFAFLHPAVKEIVMAILLADSRDRLEDAPPLREWLERTAVDVATCNPALLLAQAEDWLLCGRLDRVAAAMASRHDGVACAWRNAALLVGGDVGAAVGGFEAALKLLRQESGKRNSIFDGLCGYLYVLAMLLGDDDKTKRKAETYLQLALREPRLPANPFCRLDFFLQASAGIRQASELKTQGQATTPLAQLFSRLVDYWLGTPLSAPGVEALTELWRSAEATGFHFIAAQAAEVLGRSMGAGGEAYLERAAALRATLGFVNMANWFARQESWQRQLAALTSLHDAAGSGAAEAQTRLVWDIAVEAAYVSVAPREQKRSKATGQWTSGRAVSLKRLREDYAEMDFLTLQDRRVCAEIKLHHSRSYYGSEYRLDGKKAFVHLIDHPLVFWQHSPAIRVEVLRGKPELTVTKAAGDSYTLRLQPPFAGDARILIAKETPTRVRVVEIADEHRQIAAVIGDGLCVPAHAKDLILEAIEAISAVITVQSDLDVLPPNVEQVAADGRLHVHLLPYDDGLKLQFKVRPFATDGPYYSPGVGAECVIAEVAGKSVQARRNPAEETRAVNRLFSTCPALNDAIEHFGEWIVADPAQCLELLLQLQAQADADVDVIVLAWPEGEKFRVAREVGAANFSLSIKRHQDWFAAEGELRVDDALVIDLRQLLESLAQAPGRFLPLGGNRFMALTAEFRRRLEELRVFADSHANGVRVHALASGALEDMADAAGKLKADKHWKEHLARLRELDTLAPQLPGALQAELRDYQVSGYNWLSRLAHWGVGACLADDMGLGKTLQALALLLARAADGPALVVAPTSVCMNWLSEAARFAPTLNVILFGAGDRQQTLAELKPFDLLVVSYGLLQQEAERFAEVQWHTIVLDEAQAIKNHQTKRSQAAMALVGDFRMVCSGTPLENHLGELWNLFRFINPGLLGSLDHFNERYAVPIERQRDAVARSRLRKTIQPFILRRTKSQVLAELPSRTEILHRIDLTEQEAALYEALRREALERLAAIDAEAGQKPIQILAEIMKLRRACCNPQLVAPSLGLASSKLAAFGELLDELLENRHKTLVFSQFVDHLTLIRSYLDQRGIGYQYLDGATPMQERKRRVDAFQAGEGEVFLISLKAGGVGLNLTAADYVIHMDPWWNPAVEDQASDRAHRIGQTRPVTIYRLVARQTIEEKIVDLHKHKRALADSLLEGSDVAAKMSADEMLMLLQEELRQE